MSELVYAGPWLGNLSENGLTIKAAVHRGATTIEALVTTPGDTNFTSAQVYPGTVLWRDPTGDYPYKVIAVPIDGLTPDTQYRYALRINGKVQSVRAGTFKTFPPPGVAASFRFALGSCSGNDSFWNFGFPHTEAFDALRQERDLLFFCHLGDMHYGNIDDPEMEKRVERYTWFFEQRHHGTLYSSLPLAYVWDDHDFIGNDSAGGDDESRDAARSALDAYDLMIPHYPLVNRRYGIFQAFTVGRVRFLLLDLRFNKTTQPTSDGLPLQILGTAQREWLDRELAQASQYDLVVLCGSFPWLGTDNAHNVDDAWFSYPAERRSLAESIAARGVKNICMISGDAHMLAIDDGSNNRFTAARTKGFPVFHAAALDSRPSQKGGSYSIGDEDGGPGEGIADKRQYGVFEVTYDGHAAGPQVTWTGKRAKKNGGGSTVDVITWQFRASQAVE